MIDASEFDLRAKPTAQGRVVHGRVSAKPSSEEQAKRRANLIVREQKAARAVEYWATRKADADKRLAEVMARYAEIQAKIEAMK